VKGLELIAQANRLAQATQQRPRQVDMNRAVSTAYYALFHTLAKLCADSVVGTGAARSNKAWLQTYRALAHGFAKNACAKAGSKSFPPEIIRFASVFFELQELRHDADYDPSRIFKRSDVIPIIARAERAILDLPAAPRPDLRAFVALVLLPERR
jgi:hypothetical protein